ncbi:MAG: ATP-binding cassette domain-containing protein, partial [Deltaproteobacteria bacterium]
MSRPVLRVDGLRLSVVGNLLFHDLSFDVPPAGIVGIMGPVGTGKSSLLKWVCGTGDPSIYVGESRSAEYFYGPMKDSNRPRLLGQKAAESFEETMVMLNALLRPNP